MSINKYDRLITKIRARLKPAVVNSLVDLTLTSNEYFARALQGGIVVSNLGAAGAVTFTLPPAREGMRVKAIVETAQSLRLDPNGTETLSSTAGVTQVAGKYTACATIGGYIGLICLHAGTWDVEIFNATWTVEA